MLSQQASNPTSPLATLPRQTVIATEILKAFRRSMRIRRWFVSQRCGPSGGQKRQPRSDMGGHYQYRFSNAAMSAEDCLTNPLGFQVLRYNRDAEFLPEIPQRRARFNSTGSPDQKPLYAAAALFTCIGLVGPPVVDGTAPRVRQPHPDSGLAAKPACPCEQRWAAA